MNFAIEGPPMKVFSTKFWECHTHLHDWYGVPRKFSQQIPHFLPRKFSPLKVSHYIVPYSGKFSHCKTLQFLWIVLAGTKIRTMEIQYSILYELVQAIVDSGCGLARAMTRNL